MSPMPRLCFFLLLPGLLSACATQAVVSSDVASLAERYPPESIQTWSLSRAAQAEVKTARAEVDARLKRTEPQCYEKFFAARCVDKAKERRRVDMSLLHKIEIEANAFQRKASAADRDLSLAERQRQAANAPVKNIIPAAGSQRAGRPAATDNNEPAD